MLARIPTLSSRRSVAAMKFMYLLYREAININKSDYLKPPHRHSTRTNHDKPFRPFSSRTNSFKYSFFRWPLKLGMDYRPMLSTPHRLIALLGTRNRGLLRLWNSEGVRQIKFFFILIFYQTWTKLHCKWIVTASLRMFEITVFRLILPYPVLHLFASVLLHCFVLEETYLSTPSLLSVHLVLSVKLKTQRRAFLRFLFFLCALAKAWLIVVFSLTSRVCFLYLCV